MKKIALIPITLAVIIVVLLGVLIFVPGKQDVASSRQSLRSISITIHGGRCPDGECKESYSVTCSQEKSRCDRIASLLDTLDLAEVMSYRFTGTCPTAYDGQEVIYTIDRSDMIYIISNCKYDLSRTGDTFVRLFELVKPLN